jgi:hypothetical protein
MGCISALPHQGLTVATVDPEDAAYPAPVILAA